MFVPDRQQGGGVFLSGIALIPILNSEIPNCLYTNANYAKQRRTPSIAGFIRVFSVIFVILISPPNPGKPIIQKSVTVVTKNVVLDPLNLVGALN